MLLLVRCRLFSRLALPSRRKALSAPMSDLFHECGIAAVCHLPGDSHPLAPEGGPDEVSRLLPRMLLDIQNRGQLAAGMTSFNPGREQLLYTHKVPPSARAKKF